MLTDRDVLNGLVFAIGALAKRLTGDDLIVKFRFDDGNYRCVNLSTSDDVSWLKTSEAAQVQPSVPPEPAQTPIGTP